ncbi:MAG: M24 family metallopeptidase [Alphaproteobacteria bacterium]|nr:M24 family metallopeptidase [Alphaproteobacteria bacterium]
MSNPEYVTDAFFNEGRRKAYAALEGTLDELSGRAGITEKSFKEVWLGKLRQPGDVIAEGWYDPPPQGMAVLAGGVERPSRICFGSLRDPEFWPGNKVIDWNEGLLFVYCSPVHVATGIIGDLDMTLYFGNDPRIKEHFRLTHQAVEEVLNTLPKHRNFRELFLASQEIFRKYWLRNCVVSHTDEVLLDLGHTFPSSPRSNGVRLTKEQRDEISRARRFINNKAEWPFDDGIQFSIEPQLVSTEDPTLPQICYHYLVSLREGQFTACRDTDVLLKRYKLI